VRARRGQLPFADDDAGELLAAGAKREVKQLDEKLFFEAYTPTAEPAATKPAAGSKRR
jgi:hypothetical protein